MLLSVVALRHTMVSESGPQAETRNVAVSNSPRGHPPRTPVSPHCSHCVAGRGVARHLSPWGWRKRGLGEPEAMK